MCTGSEAQEQSVTRAMRALGENLVSDGCHLPWYVMGSLQSLPVVTCHLPCLFPIFLLPNGVLVIAVGHTITASS